MGFDRPAVDREALIDWVAKFLNYWEDTGMLLPACGGDHCQSNL